MMQQDPRMQPDLVSLNTRLFTHFDCMGFTADGPHIVDLLEEFVSANPGCDLWRHVESDVQY